MSADKMIRRTVAALAGAAVIIAGLGVPAEAALAEGRRKAPEPFEIQAATLNPAAASAAADKGRKAFQTAIGRWKDSVDNGTEALAEQERAAKASKVDLGRVHGRGG